VAALKVVVVGPEGLRVGRFRVEVKPVIKAFAATPPRDEPRPRRKSAPAPSGARSGRPAAKSRPR